MRRRLSLLAFLVGGAGCNAILDNQDHALESGEGGGSRSDATAGGNVGTSDASGSDGESAAKAEAGADASALESGSVASSDGSQGTDANPCAMPGDAALGVLGCTCPSPGKLACNGNAQSVTLICSAGVWTQNQTCSAGFLCDSRLGPTQGTCQPIDPSCAGASPGQSACGSATAVVQCGPDLVSESLSQTCAAGAPVCLRGACVLCSPGASRCEGNARQACDDAGDWATGVTCGAICAGSECLNPIAISARDNQVCVVLADDTVWCWGGGYDGTPVRGAVPVEVANVPGISALAAGGSQTCALLTNGTVTCWGTNGQGQLGNGTTIDSLSPVPVSNLSGVMAIAAGAQHTCAVLSSGLVWCWGSNSYGELGGFTASYSSIPVAVPGLSAVTAIAAGEHDVCALSSGVVSCWGADFGELNQQGAVNSSMPVGTIDVTNAYGPGAEALAVLSGNECVLLSGGSVGCWPDNSFGIAGDGITANPTPPNLVSSVTSAVAIAATDTSACALLRDGTVACWGSDGLGELGTGTTTGLASCSEGACADAPVVVPSLSGVEALALGGGDGDYACALLSSGTVACWGDNYHQELGGGTANENSDIPVFVQWPTASP